jgi:hypothetical protein
VLFQIANLLQQIVNGVFILRDPMLVRRFVVAIYHIAKRWVVLVQVLGVVVLRVVVLKVVVLKVVVAVLRVVAALRVAAQVGHHWRQAHSGDLCII